MSIKTRVRKAWKAVTATALALVASIAAFFGIDIEAQTTPVVDTLAWSAPTQYVDNSPIPAGAITGYRYAWGSTAGGPYPNETAVGNVLTVAVTRPGDGYGNRCYKVAAVTGTTVGLWSAEGCKNVQAPAKAPGSFAVQ